MAPGADEGEASYSVVLNARLGNIWYLRIVKAADHDALGQIASGEENGDMVAYVGEHDEAFLAPRAWEEDVHPAGLNVIVAEEGRADASNAAGLLLNACHYAECDYRAWCCGSGLRRRGEGSEFAEVAPPSIDEVVDAGEHIACVARAFEAFQFDPAPGSEVGGAFGNAPKCLLPCGVRIEMRLGKGFDLVVVLNSSVGEKVVAATADFVKGGLTGECSGAGTRT